MSLSLLLLLACSPETEDTGEPQVTDPGCEVLEIQVDGEDPPSVGDLWTVGLHCDGAALLGATVVLVDPADTAQIDVNHVHFTREGELTLWVQVGRYRSSRQVDVQAAAP
ncbi:MAG: hypothetical protein JXX28_07895 [Deltaproteobacteria bacterium]|nr:hypothetical protein [Deltaproteobacteria bacterium]